MHLLLTGGGTAGHINPNLALIEHLQHSEKIKNLKITYIASNSDFDRQYLKKQPVKSYFISAGKLRRYFSFQNFLDIFKIIIGFFQSLYIIKKTKPDLIFSKGGFVSIPVVYAGAVLRVPIITHESDSIAGLATKLATKVATEVWGEYLNLSQSLGSKYKQVKLPIRHFLSQGVKTNFKSDASKPNLLVLGGSQGAKVLNDFIYNSIEQLSKHFNIIHVSGQNKLQAIKSYPYYYQFEFMDKNLADAYAWADLVLSRSGASTLQELAFLNKKAVLVPLSKNQSRGEQLYNAQHFCKTNTAKIIQENSLNIDTFLYVTEKILQTKSIHNAKHQKTHFSAELLFAHIPSKRKRV